METKIAVATASRGTRKEAIGSSVSAEGGRVESSQGTRHNSLMRVASESRRELPREVPRTKHVMQGQSEGGKTHLPGGGCLTVASEAQPQACEATANSEAEYHSL